MRLSILGASGRTGQLLVTQALAAGHTVRALVREAAKLQRSDAGLEVLVGDASDGATVARLVEGADAVLSALGPRKGAENACSVATAHVIAARPKRYVLVSGAGVDVAGDEKDFVGKLVSFMVRTLDPAVFNDKVRELGLLEASAVPYVLVRPPRLTEGAGTGAARMDLKRSPGASLARADLAAFMLRCLADDALLRKAPFLAG